MGFVVGVGDGEDGWEPLPIVGLTVSDTDGTTGRVVTAGDVDGREVGLVVAGTVWNRQECSVKKLIIALLNNYVSQQLWAFLYGGN